MQQLQNVLRRFVHSLPFTAILLLESLQSSTEQTSGFKMAARKQFQSSLTINPELKLQLEQAKQKEVTEAELREQRISFAFGNALQSERITKDSVRFASEHIKLKG